MQKILILGIGRSTYYLLQYLHDTVMVKNNISITAMDVQAELVVKRSKEFPKITFLQSDIDATSILPIISKTDIVVSMLPPVFHTMVAELCLHENKHFFTASYVSTEIKAMSEQAKSQGLLFMMECGLDPGIDHMSAISLIHDLKEKGAHITSFESYTGGLVHPAHINPPWNYKVSWNPRNVVLAGQGTAAQYRKDGVVKVLPYHRLFAAPSTWQLSTDEIYEGYPNRDSLSYQKLYDLLDADTFVRGTLRYPGFCKGWNDLVQLGLTDDTVIIEADINRTPRSFLQHFLIADGESIEDKLKVFFQQEFEEALHFIQTIGLLSDNTIITKACTAAVVLQSLIENTWKLQQGDRDRIVMIHRLSYLLKGKAETIQSYMLVDGEDSERTAMAKTVGLPLAISVELFLMNKISERGVVIPTSQQLAGNILLELSKQGIHFNEMYI